MTKQQSKEPKQEWGFYGVVPRIVRTQYKTLSLGEKWLYTCLKDLCGDKGACFRSLRALAEETDISTGSLSTMIPKLHEVGLIHATKKRRSMHGKEIWHITIVDIWQENAKQCSKIEQSASEKLPENVQKLNDVVQKLNKDENNLSTDCSKIVDRRITMKNTKEEYNITANLSYDKSSSNNSSSFSNSPQEDTPTSKRTKQNEQAVEEGRALLVSRAERAAASIAARPVQDIPHAAPVPERPSRKWDLTLQEHATADLWDSLHTTGCNRSGSKVKAALRHLTAQHATKETLKYAKEKLAHNPFWKEITIELVADKYQGIMDTYTLSQDASGVPDSKNDTSNALTPEEDAMDWNTARRTISDNLMKWIAYKETHEAPQGNIAS